MKPITFAVLLFATLAFTGLSLAEGSPDRVLYTSGVHTLEGHIYKPAGKGPFPAVIFNQAHPNKDLPANQKPFQTLAHMFTSKGWVFFVPGRHPLGPTIEKNKADSPEEKMVQAHEKQAANIAAAVLWLKSENYVDSRRIIMMGQNAGGVSSLFAVEKNPEICAMVLFSPGIKSIEKQSVKDRIKAGVAQAKFPIFLIQTESDRSLRPSDIINVQMEQRGGLDRIKVYPAYGSSPSESHKFAAEGYEVWQSDFFAFAREVFAAGSVVGKSTN